MIAKFKNKPAKNCYANAIKYMEVLYQRVRRTLNQMKDYLASGESFVFGFAVYGSSENTPVGRPGDESLRPPGSSAISKHAAAGIGCDEGEQWFVTRNSWRTRWKIKAYITRLCADLTGKIWQLISGQFVSLSR